jgi:hypothetical protein
MCDLCDRPELTGDDVLNDISQRIARDRFTAVSVGGSRTRAEFSYSVGLTEHGCPELIVTGLRSEQAAGLLRLWGDYLLDESVVLPGEMMDADPWFLQAVQVERPREHLLIADRFYGEGLRALQLVWADAAGRWPWEPGHRGRPAGQPVLGEPAPWYCDPHAQDRLGVPPHL